MTQEMREEMSLLDKVETNKKRLKLDLKKFNSLLFISIIVFGVCYLLTMNDLSVKGFQLQELKKEAKDLNDDNKNLELETMNLASYGNLSERIAALRIVKAGKANFIESGSPAVPKK